MEPAGQEDGNRMRYARLADIVKLAVLMQGRHTGVTLDEMEARFGVSRKTAERMRDAVEMAFGPLELAESNDNRNHWRLRSDAVRRLVPLSAEELAELEAAAGTLERTGFEARAAALRALDTKLRATQHTGTLERIESDIEALVQAEGLGHAPRPQAAARQGPACVPARSHRHLPHRRGPLPLRSPPAGMSRQRIEPYGLLYGNRAFLVGRTDWNDAMRLWRLVNMSEAQRDRRELHPRPRLRSGGVRPALLRHLPGGAGRRGAALYGRGEARRRRLPLPPQPDDGGERRRHPHRSASPPAASARCAGTSSPGARV